MARKTYVFQTNPDGSYVEPLQMVEKHERKYSFRGTARKMGSAKAHVIADIEPYQSTLTGETIGSRSKHRAHLREHGCVEIGNESMSDAQKHFQKDNREFERQRKEEIIETVNRAYEGR